MFGVHNYDRDYNRIMCGAKYEHNDDQDSLDTTYLSYKLVQCKQMSETSNNPDS
jgi:hypothetical protein